MLKWCTIKVVRRGYMRFKVVLEPAEEGGYTVYVPSLPGCISEGETIEEALANIKEAIELYLEPVDEDLVVDERAVVREIEVEQSA
jgi:predicted RNase H-like HicB family nuclease